MLQAGRFYRKDIIREEFLESEGMGIRGERTANKSGGDTKADNLGEEGSEAKAGTLKEVGKLWWPAEMEQLQEDMESGCW